MVCSVCAGHCVDDVSTSCVVRGMLVIVSDTKPPPREVFPVRIAPSALAEVRRLAELETEGNVSMMIRKLLSEAMSARAGSKRR